MFTMGQYVQIINHSEPSCNGEYGYVTLIHTAYDGTKHYTVRLEEDDQLCSCIDDELMEG